MSINKELLPKEFRYDTDKQTVEVEYVDGSIVRYFGIDARSLFLSPINERRNYDFFNFLEHNCVSPFSKNPVCARCKLPPDLRQKVIQEETKEIGGPQTRPELTVRGQNAQAEPVKISGFPLARWSES